MVSAGLSVVLLGFALPLGDVSDPAGAVALVVVGTSLGVLAVVPTWRGLLLAVALLLTGTSLLPPPSGEADPEGTRRLVLGVAAFLTLWSMWTPIFRRMGWSVPFGVRLGAVLWSWAAYLAMGTAILVSFWASGRIPNGVAYDSDEMIRYWLGQPEVTVVTTTGLLAAGLQGYIAAAAARRRPLVHAGLSSVLHLAWLTMPPSYSAPYVWGNLLGSVAATLLGGILFSRRSRRIGKAQVEAPDGVGSSQ